jgi:polysaccharide biosynthesis/export protein
MITSLYRLVSIIFLLIAAVSLGGCPGSSGIADSPAGEGKFVSASDNGAVGGTAAASAQRVFAENASLSNASKNEEYKIAALDVLDVSVFGVAELNRTAQVSATGVMSMPLIGTVVASGKTVGQLEKEIARKLEAGYLQSPQVSVFIKEYNSQRVTVDGAVNKPGIYPIQGQVSLLQAISLAEGISTLADPTGILLFRVVDNRRMAARFDLKQIRLGKTDDPVLKAGDIVMVDESAARTMLRDVKEVLPISGVFRMLLL